MSQRNINMQNETEPHQTNRNRTLRLFSSPMISSPEGRLVFHDRFSSSIVGPNHQVPNNMIRTYDLRANPNEPISAMRTNNISPLPINRICGSNLLLNQRVGAHCFVPAENNNHNIGPSIVPPHCNNGHYSDDKNKNNFQNLSLDLTLGVQNYNGDDNSSNGSGAWNMSHKRTNRFAFSEFVVGESSNAGAQAAAAAAGGIPKRHASIENGSVSSSPSCICICITCPVHGNPGPHHQGGTSGNYNSRLTAAHVQQTARIGQGLGNNALAQSTTVAAPNYVMPSHGYMPGGHGQQCSTYQHYYVSSCNQQQESSSYRSVGEYTPSWSSIMWPSAVAQRHAPSGRGNNMNGVHNSNIAGGFLGNGSSSSNFVAPAFHELSSIARSWIHRLNVHQEYLRMSSSLENQGGAANDVAPLPPYLSDPDKLMQEIRNAINHLRNGGSIRLEELLILDYSIVLNLIDSVNDDLNDDDEDDWDDVQYEDLVDMENQIGYVDVGLSEDQILAHIGQETFESVADQEYQNDTCSICQDDYGDGEQIGRLDCRHLYHLECIQQWLMIKNTCPICKQVALPIVGHEDENDE